MIGTGIRTSLHPRLMRCSNATVCFLCERLPLVSGGTEGVCCMGGSRNPGRPWHHENREVRSPAADRDLNVKASSTRNRERSTAVFVFWDSDMAALRGWSANERYHWELYRNEIQCEFEGVRSIVHVPTGATGGQKRKGRK